MCSLTFKLEKGQELSEVARDVVRFEVQKNGIKLFHFLGEENFLANLEITMADLSKNELILKEKNR